MIRPEKYSGNAKFLMIRNMGKGIIELARHIGGGFCIHRRD